MTVKELINELQKYPDDMVVVDYEYLEEIREVGETTGWDGTKVVYI